MSRFGFLFIYPFHISLRYLDTIIFIKFGKLQSQFLKSVTLCTPSTVCIIHTRREATPAPGSSAPVSVRLLSGFSVCPVCLRALGSLVFSSVLPAFPCPPGEFFILETEFFSPEALFVPFLSAVFLPVYSLIPSSVFFAAGSVVQQPIRPRDSVVCSIVRLSLMTVTLF